MAGSVASTYLVKGLIRRGVVFPGERLAVFGSEDLFGATQWASQRMPAKRGLSAFAADLADLKPGDHVVNAGGKLVTPGLVEPPVTIELAQDVVVLPDGAPRSVRVTVRAAEAPSARGGPPPPSSPSSWPFPP